MSYTSLAYTPGAGKGGFKQRQDQSQLRRRGDEDRNNDALVLTQLAVSCGRQSGLVGNKALELTLGVKT